MNEGKVFEIALAVVVLATTLGTTACGRAADSAAKKRAAPRVKSTITRVVGTTTVVSTAIATVDTQTSTGPSAGELRKEAFDTGYYNCKQLPLEDVRRAVQYPSYRPTFVRMVEESVAMATGGHYMRTALLGCLKALKPRLAHAERAFAGQHLA